MQKLLLFCAIAACGSGSGCSMMLSGARTLVLEPLHYCAPKNVVFATIRNRKFAEQAWKEVVAQAPQQEFSHHYEDGFKDGYCDYLFFGGPGNPPPVPPRRYWRRYHKTPEGHLAIGQWYSGFAHGASMAQASGYREFITVPSSLGPVPAPAFSPAPMPLPGLPNELIAPPVEEVPPPLAATSPHGVGMRAANHVQPTTARPQAVPTEQVPPRLIAASGPQAIRVGYGAARHPLPSQPESAVPLPSNHAAMPMPIQPLPITQPMSALHQVPLAVPPLSGASATIRAPEAPPAGPEPAFSSDDYLGPWSGPGAQRLLRASQPHATSSDAFTLQPSTSVAIQR